jgi:dihydroorotase
MGAIIMPNLMKTGPDGRLIIDSKGQPIPDPIDSIQKARTYRDRINETRTDYFMHRVPYIGNKEDQFTPCMTLYLTDHTDPEDVVRGWEEGVWCAVKLYMADQQGQGGTTGSAHGVKNLISRYKVFEAMEKYQIPLLGHFEAVEEDVDEFDREIVSVERDLKPILKSFPGLPVVFEHLTDGRAAEFVAEVDHNIQATVTAHHLMINRNAMFWGGMNSVNYCKPVPKREKHRAKVRRYVTSGNRRFGAGTDSAPHDKSAKMRCCGCAAGIFTAPCAVELYTTIFDEDGALEHLGPFLSENFLHLYGMEVSQEMMEIENIPLQVPEMIGPVHVFKGGTELPWKLRV